MKDILDLSEGKEREEAKQASVNSANKGRVEGNAGSCEQTGWIKLTIPLTLSQRVQ